MATLTQIYNARTDSSLIAKTEAAILVASTDVKNENPSTPNHTERLACAKACLSSEEYLQKIVHAAMYPIASNDTIAGNPGAASDNDIKYVVNSAYDDLALTNPPA